MLRIPLSQCYALGRIFPEYADGTLRKLTANLSLCPFTHGFLASIAQNPCEGISARWREMEICPFRAACKIVLLVENTKASTLAVLFYAVRSAENLSRTDFAARPFASSR